MIQIGNNSVKESERISIHLHVECCRKLKQDNSLLTILKENLNKKNKDLLPIKDWIEVINTEDIKKIINFTLQKKNLALKHRDGSPFAGILSQNEVISIKTKYRKYYKEYNKRYDENTYLLSLYTINKSNYYKISEIEKSIKNTELNQFNNYIKGMTLLFFEDETYLYDIDFPYFLRKYLKLKKDK